MTTAAETARSVLTYATTRVTAAAARVEVARVEAAQADTRATATYNTAAHAALALYDADADRLTARDEAAEAAEAAARAGPR
jgi:hypothetical protein